MKIDAVYAPLRRVPEPDFAKIPSARRMMAIVQALTPKRRSKTVAVDDRLIDGPAGKLKIRVYRPDGAGKRGALLYFHGGGFVVGDLDSEHAWCVRYAEGAGCVVVSVDYRLAPEHLFPAAHEDGWRALSWLQASAAELGVDVARIGIGGASAGATLAAGLALRARDEGAPALRFALLTQPALDHTCSSFSARTFEGTPFVSAHLLPQIWSTYFGASPPDGKALSYGAPAAAPTLKGFPPTFLIAGDVDPLRDEQLAFAMRLVQDGTEVELHLLPGAPHGFDFVEKAPAAQQMMGARIAALARALASDGDQASLWKALLPGRWGRSEPT